MSKYSRKFKRALALVLTFVMAVSVITVTPSTNVEAASNKVVKSLAGVPAAKTMNVGETTSFKANVKTTKKVAKNLLQVTVKSSNSSVVAAKVAAKPKNKKKAKKGASVIKLTARKAGKATITVTTKAKNKKNKKVTKKMVVTVAEPTTQATTQATTAATTQAPTTEKPREEATTEKKELDLQTVEVTSSVGKVIYKGGQTQLSVVSTTDGVSIASVSYKSKNSAILDVDEDGLVTGKGTGSASVVVTARDANGKAVSSEYVITVKEEYGATITLDKTNEAIAIGQSLQINATVTKNVDELKVQWTSTDSSVASVDKDGKVTAKKNGTTVITATLAGSAVVATCNITVKDAVVGIRSFKAIGASKLQVELSAAVPEVDRDKIGIVLKTNNTEITPDVIWNESGNSFVFARESAYVAGSYVVSISNQGLTIDEANAEATVMVEAEKVSDIEITTDVLPKYVNARVHYNALNQYGEVMAAEPADTFKWEYTCPSDPSIVTDVVNATQTGYVIVNTSKMAAETDFINVHVKKDNANIDVNKNIYIKGLMIQHIEINGLIGKAYQNDEEDHPFNLTYSMKDQYGNDIDLGMWEAYANYKNVDATFSVDEEGAKICSRPRVEHVDKEKPTLSITVYRGAYGEATISANGADNKSTRYKIIVNKASEPAKIVYSNEVKTVVAGDVLEIPVQFVDQYGQEMGTVNKNVVDDTFSFNVLGDKEYINALNDKSVEYNVENSKGYLSLKTLGLDSKGELTIRATDSSGKAFDQVIEVKAPRKAHGIVDNKDGCVIPDKTLLTGETTTAKFLIKDPYGEVWKDDGSYLFDVEVTTGQDYISIEKYRIVEGKGYVVIKGKKSTKDLDATLKPVVTLSIISNGKVVDSKKYSFEVYNNATSIVANINSTEVVAGQKVKIDLVAKYNNTVLDSFNEKFESVKVFEGAVADNVYSIIDNVEFVKGKASIEVIAKKAQDAVKYSFTLDSPYDHKDDGTDKVTLEVETKEIKIKVANPNRFVVKQSANKTDYTITCVDNQGNVITDLTKDDVPVAISIKDGTVEIEDVDRYFDGISSDGKVLVKFVNGEAVITATDIIPTNYEVTISNTTIVQGEKISGTVKTK